MADAQQQLLITRTAAAIKRDGRARAALLQANEEAMEAGRELEAAWTALRDFQDEQVKRAMVIDGGDRSIVENLVTPQAA